MSSSAIEGNMTGQSILVSLDKRTLAWEPVLQRASSTNDSHQGQRTMNRSVSVGDIVVRMSEVELDSREPT